MKYICTFGNIFFYQNAENRKKSKNFFYNFGKWPKTTSKLLLKLFIFGKFLNINKL